MFKKNDLFFIGCSLFVLCYLSGCVSKTEKKPVGETVDYIHPISGESDSIPVEIARQGEVLISYSDCYSCHKVDQRSMGPAFTDIAKRYPVNTIYIEMLGRKIINGANRSWGYSVMAPHPQLSLEHTKLMVSYILSLRK